VASAAEAAATQQQYLAQVALTATMTAALDNVAQAAPDPTSSAYRAGIHAVIDQLAQVAASIARDYYQQIRKDAGITAPIRIQPIPAPPASLIDASVDYGLRASNASTPADFQAAVQRRVEAANQKILADAAREQTASAVAGDEMAIGFRRVPRPDACAFCILMATRSTHREGLAADLSTSSHDNKRGIKYGGPEHFGVYKSRALAEGKSFVRDFIGEGTAKFHNHCHCVVEPVFSPVEKLPAWLEGARQLYKDTSLDPARRDDTHLNAFRRALNAQRSGNGGSPSPIAPAAPLRAAPAQPPAAALLQGLDDAMRAGAA
jgi:hypothetical protein